VQALVSGDELVGEGEAVHEAPLLSQKMEQKLPEKKMPSTHAKATSRSWNDVLLLTSSVHKSQQMCQSQAGTSSPHTEERCGGWSGEGDTRQPCQPCTTRDKGRSLGPTNARDLAIPRSRGGPALTRCLRLIAAPRPVGLLSWTQGTVCTAWNRRCLSLGSLT